MSKKTPLPSFLVKNVPKSNNIRKIRELLADPSLHTVCEEAKCPNIGECFAEQTCTFMILGQSCTRHCAFCGVAKGKTQAVDPKEPAKIAAAVAKLQLTYVVITSVTRDDLADGGAGHFASVIKGLRASNPVLKVEVLVPDFLENLGIVLKARPFTLNHNIETVPRLYPQIRPQADYQRSLSVIKQAKCSGEVVYTKSGFMVGLGEERQEVEAVLADLKAAGCDLVTIGQYLPPSREHLPPVRYVPPEEFEGYKELGKKFGFTRIFAGPFVRSSYHAARIKE